MKHLVCLALLLSFAVGCGDDSSQEDAGVVAVLSDASSPRNDAGESEADAEVTIATCDAGPRTCSCQSDLDCDDGAFCTGVERCEPGNAASDIFGCVVGEAPKCDDGVKCTKDSCKDDACMFTPRDGDDDGAGDIECRDADGKALGNDCDDDSDDISPFVTEVCNEIDDDCDGKIDEGVSVKMYPDTDGDQHGDIKSKGKQVCAGTAHFAAYNDDCDDSDTVIYGGHPEVCDGADNDCDGMVDEVGGCVQ